MQGLFDGADADDGVEGALDIQPAHDDLVALVHLAQHIRLWHKGILEDQFAGG